MVTVTRTWTRSGGMTDVDLIGLLRKTILNFAYDTSAEISNPDVVELADRIAGTLALAGALEDGLASDVMIGRKRDFTYADEADVDSDVEYDDDGGFESGVEYDE